MKLKSNEKKIIFSLSPFFLFQNQFFFSHCTNVWRDTNIQKKIKTKNRARW